MTLAPSALSSASRSAAPGAAGPRRPTRTTCGAPVRASHRATSAPEGAGAAGDEHGAARGPGLGGGDRGAHQPAGEGAGGADGELIFPSGGGEGGDQAGQFGFAGVGGQVGKAAPPVGVFEGGGPPQPPDPGGEGFAEGFVSDGNGLGGDVPQRRGDAGIAEGLEEGGAERKPEWDGREVWSGVDGEAEQRENAGDGIGTGFVERAAPWPGIAQQEVGLAERRLAARTHPPQPTSQLFPGKITLRERHRYRLGPRLRRAPTTPP